MNKTKDFRFRLTEQDLKQLKGLAIRRNMKPSKLLRTYIRAAAKREGIG